MKGVEISKMGEDKMSSKFEIDNNNQKDRDMMQGDDAQFAQWLINDAKKYGVNGRKYR